jgi:hypothetical protein
MPVACTFEVMQRATQVRADGCILIKRGTLLYDHKSQ